MNHKVIEKFLVGVFIFLFFISSIFSSGKLPAQQSKDPLYSGRHALIIGIDYNKKNQESSDRSNRSVAKNLERLKEELKKRKFEVTLETNLHRKALKSEITNFFQNDDIEENDQMFLWITANSYTPKDNKSENYIIPAGATGNSKNRPKEYLSLDHIFNQVDYPKAKHIFIVLDAKFSNSIVFAKPFQNSKIATCTLFNTNQVLVTNRGAEGIGTEIDFAGLFIDHLNRKLEIGDSDFKTASQIFDSLVNDKKINKARFAPFLGILGENSRGENVFMSNPFDYVQVKLAGRKNATFKMAKLPPNNDLKLDAVSIHEVTVNQYKEFLMQVDKTNKLLAEIDKNSEILHLPVTEIKWEDAVEYARWLTKNVVDDGYLYRLPSEREWDYFSDKITIEKSMGNIKPVNQNEEVKYVCYSCPNKYGIYDVIGNVWEWTCTIYRDKKNNKSEERVQHSFVSGAETFTIKGGDCKLIVDDINKSADQIRKEGFPTRIDKDSYYGFRLVRVKVKGDSDDQ